MKNPFNKWLQKILLSFLLLTIVTPTYALRCGNDIVQIGDSTARVLKVCGKPQMKNKAKKELKTNINHKTIAAISQWTYNFGPQDFLYILSFKDGKLAAIDTNGYGG